MRTSAPATTCGDFLRATQFLVDEELSTAWGLYGMLKCQIMAISLEKSAKICYDKPAEGKKKVFPKKLSTVRSGSIHCGCYFFGLFLPKECK